MIRWIIRPPNVRVGQMGRNTHVWYRRGRRPVAPTDERFKSVHVYGAVHPGTDDAFGLILPHADTAMMSLFLVAFSASLPPKVHAVLVMDKAGRHVTGRLKCRRTSASSPCRRIPRH